MLIQLLTTTTAAPNLLDARWFNDKDLSPSSSVDALWLLVVLFIVVLVLAPKLKSFKERVSDMNMKAVFLWVVVIGLLAGLFYYFDGMSYIQAYLN